MQYRRDRAGNSISALGFGCMRFEGGGTGDSFQAANDQVMAAVAAGVNYLDTAYVYKNNEKVLGRILAENGCRDRVSIATKLPHYLVRSAAGARKMFAQELEWLQTDWVDYYLLHMLNDRATFEKLKGMGVISWLEELKSEGKIRQLGFSYHGSSEDFIPLLDAYDWDFCQIQYNYLDENIQAGRKGLEYAAGKGIPVIIMEPLRGGRLVGLLPEESKARLKAAAKEGIIEGDENTSVQTLAARLAFRWLLDQPGVTCILSGMNSMQMVQENLKTADECPPGSLTEGEKELIRQIREDFERKVRVGCTGCGYCMPCPKGVDIPAAFQSYNMMRLENPKDARWKYLQQTIFRHDTTDLTKCVGCGACTRKCPQHLPIPDLLKEAEKELLPFTAKAMNRLLHLFRFY